MCLCLFKGRIQLTAMWVLILFFFLPLIFLSLRFTLYLRILPVQTRQEIRKNVWKEKDKQIVKSVELKHSSLFTDCLFTHRPLILTCSKLSVLPLNGIESLKLISLNCLPVHNLSDHLTTVFSLLPCGCNITVFPNLSKYFDESERAGSCQKIICFYALSSNCVTRLQLV